MIKKYIVIFAMLLVVGLAASGCTDMGGLLGQPTPTAPPEKKFASVEEFSAAVAAAKADTSGADVENLKALTYYYGIKNPPDGAKITLIKVSAETVIVGYTFGPTTTDSFDNQMQIIWYRNRDASTYLSNVASAYTNYSTVSANNIDYLFINPDIQIQPTADPSAAANAPTPTPRTTKYCQFVYWVQDNIAFMGAVPLGVTKDDIPKYCVAEKVDMK